MSNQNYESIEKLCSTLAQLYTYHDYYKPYRFTCTDYDYEENEKDNTIVITLNIQVEEVKYKLTGNKKVNKNGDEYDEKDFNNYKVLGKTQHELEFVIDRNNLGLMVMDNKRKTSINSARYQPKLRFTKNSIMLFCKSPIKESRFCYYKINIAENMIALDRGEYVFKLSSLVKAYGLFDKYSAYLEDDQDENIGEIVKILKSYTIDDKAMAKLKLISEGQFEPTSKYLDKHLLEYLLDAYFIDYPNHEELNKYNNRYCDKFNQQTPLDFSFMDAIDSLCYDLNEQYQKIHTSVSYIYSKNIKSDKGGKVVAKNMSPVTVQNMITKYFHMQTNNFHDIQTTKDSNTLTIRSQAKTIYFYDKFDQEENVRKDDWMKQKVYNDYFVGVLDPTRTRDGPLINKNNELALCTDIRKDEIYITVEEIKTGKDVELTYADMILSPILASDCYDFRTREIVKNKNKYSVSQYGKYTDYDNLKDLPKDMIYVRKRENLLSYATSMMPFTNRMVSTRTLLASHFLDQSIPVIGAQPPIVHTSAAREFYKDNPEATKSTVTGTVMDVKDGLVKVKTSDGKIKVFGKNRYTKTTMSTTNEYIPQVKIGQKIKPGQILISSNSFKDGEFTTQVPLYVAFGTYEGREHEDGIILTESAAKKFGHISDLEISEDFSSRFYYAFKRNSIQTEEEYSKVKIVHKNGKRVVVKDKSKSLDDLEAIREKNVLDDWCLVKKGSTVTAGSVLFEYYQYDKDEVNLNIKKLIADDNAYDTDVTRKLMQVKVPYNVRGKGIVKEVKLVVNNDTDIFYDGYDKDSDSYDRPGSLGVNYDDNMEAFKYFKRNGEEDSRELRNWQFDKDEVAWKISDDNNSFELRITIQYTDEMSSERLGGKLSNFYASKGVNVYIIPDKYAPYDSFGNKIEGFINTGTTFSRQNPGQIDECKLGLIGLETWKRIVKDGNPRDKSTKAFLDKLYPHGWNWDSLVKDGEKYGYCRVEVEPFEKYYTHNVILDLLKDLKLNTKKFPNGDCKVYLPEFDKETEFNCTVGVTSMMRLHFIQEHKASVTAEKSIESDSDNITYRELDKDGGQKMGQMEQHQGLAHGIFDILDDIAIQEDRLTKKTEYASAMFMLGMKLK